MLGLSEFLQKIQIWEQCVSDNVQNEVDLLKSWTNISETLLKKKQTVVLNSCICFFCQQSFSNVGSTHEQIHFVSNIVRNKLFPYLILL